MECKLKTCNTCGETKPLEGFSPFKKNKRDGRRGYCKACNSAKQNVRQKKNPDYLAAQRSYYAANKEQRKAHMRRYAKENAPAFLSRNATRRSRCALATPAWADLTAIAAVYAECSRITKATGVRHHVDHIVPLRGRTVSGLHVAHNLQIITASENLAKSNNWESV